ncbi:MAG: hypothetical protein ACRD39_01340 [Nitrososphaeraceae archaeon]
MMENRHECNCSFIVFRDYSRGMIGFTYLVDIHFPTVNIRSKATTATFDKMAGYDQLGLRILSQRMKHFFRCLSAGQCEPISILKRLNMNALPVQSAFGVAKPQQDVGS